MQGAGREATAEAVPGDTRVRTKEKERAKKSLLDTGETPDGPTGEEDSVAGGAGEGEALGWRGALCALAGACISWPRHKAFPVPREASGIRGFKVGQEERLQLLWG